MVGETPGHRGHWAWCMPQLFHMALGERPAELRFLGLGLVRIIEAVQFLGLANKGKPPSPKKSHQLEGTQATVPIGVCSRGPFIFGLFSRGNKRDATHFRGSPLRHVPICPFVRNLEGNVQVRFQAGSLRARGYVNGQARIEKNSGAKTSRVVVESWALKNNICQVR